MKTIAMEAVKSAADAAITPSINRREVGGSGSNGRASEAPTSPLPSPPSAGGEGEEECVQQVSVAWHERGEWGISAVAGETPKGKIPLAVKIAFTAFMAVLVPTYWRNYGPTNFLYFCDVALLVTLAGVWLESSLLISMAGVGILLPQMLWLVDFGGHLLGMQLTGMTNYMFDAQRPVFLRGLSLFHGWLPLLLVWLLGRVGYDKRAFPLWTVLAAALVLVSYFFLPAAGAHLANANTPVNVDYVYGFSDEHPQHWMNQNLYVSLWIATLTGAAFWPTHLALRKVCRPASSADAKVGNVQ